METKITIVSITRDYVGAAYIKIANPVGDEKRASGYRHENLISAVVRSSLIKMILNRNRLKTFYERRAEEKTCKSDGIVKSRARDDADIQFSGWITGS